VIAADTCIRGGAGQLLQKEPGDQRYALEENTLHVWCLSLDALEHLLPMLRRYLSEDECVRAGKYFFDKDRKRFILRRAVLRVLIGNYLEVDAQRIRLRYGEKGKPGLADNYGDQRLNFNISHAENLALYAFASKRRVGIDIEYVRPFPEMPQIVESCFSEREKTVYAGLPADRQKEFFFRCWTRKEAVLKATGEGLEGLTSGSEITSADGLPQIRDKRETSDGVHVEDLFPAPGFAAAYAVEGTSPLRCVFRKGSEGPAIAGL